MFTIENVFNLLIEVMNLTLCFLFSWNFQKRKHFFLRSSISIVVSLIIGFFSRSIYIPNSPIVSLSLTYILVFATLPITLFICFDYSYTSALFIGIIAYSFRHMVYLLWQLIANLIQDLMKIDLSVFSFIWVVIAFVSFLVYLPALIFLYRKIKTYPNIALPSFEILLVAVFAVIITIILNTFSVFYDRIDTLPISLPYVLNMFAFVSSGMVILLLIGNAKRISLESEIVAVNQLRYQEEKQYEMTKESIDLINIKCHDLRHQLRHFSEKNAVIDKEELGNIEKAIRIYDTRTKTGNRSLDIILQEKSLICDKNNITFDCIIDGKQLDFIKESDIYSLFGNIIDNAIESCMKIENPSKRTITLKVKQAANGVFCYEENPYVKKISFKNGLPISTKGDPRFHGFGMKSILSIVKSYHGTMKVKAENERFCLSIFFQKNDGE